MNNLEKAARAILSDSAAKTLADRNLLMPDLPKHCSLSERFWLIGGVEICAKSDGAVTVEFESPSDIDNFDTATRYLTLTRAQVLAILAASEWNPNDQH